MWKSLNTWIKRIDGYNLWYLGIPFLILLFVPILVLGEGSVFSIYDQLDETLFTYVITAGHLFSGESIFPEMLGGIPASGVQPAAVLFVPFYRFLPLFHAFVLQYVIVCASAFYGMYLLVRRVTDSSGLSLVAGALFAMLPYQPVYGLSIVGVPLLLYCFINLYNRKHIGLSMAGIIYFGLTTHLVLIGYVSLTYLAVGGLVLLIKHRGFKKQDMWYYIGVAALFIVYCAVNFNMFLQLIVGTGDFVSHREEILNNTENIHIWDNIKAYFLSGGQHVETCQQYMMLPMLLITVLQGIRYKKLSEKGKSLYKLLLLLWGIAALTAVVAGISVSEPVMAWKNTKSGFFHYFQMDRYYWVYAALWMFAFTVALSLLWLEFPKVQPIWKVILLAILVLPTANLIKVRSVLYENVNQYNNGSAITGYQTWEDFYMEDVLAQVDDYIGRDKFEYRVASLGICPAPALMYGFYTIDGYSNNYSLEYKHEFREIIEGELEKNNDNRVYFDTWGSRCYLFASESGKNWFIQKTQDFRYEDLELNTEKMAELGCEYLFSAAQIVNAEEIGLHLEGRFDTEESLYEIWLYRIER